MKTKLKWYFMGCIMLYFVFDSSVPVHAAAPSAAITAKVNYTESNLFLKRLNVLRKKKGLPTVKLAY